MAVYTEDPFQRIVHLHWGHIPGHPEDPPPEKGCDNGCEDGPHDLPTQLGPMEHRNQLAYFYYQPFLSNVYAFGPGTPDVKQAIVYQPRFVPPYNMPGDPQQTYLIASCANKITISLRIDHIVNVADPNSDNWIAVWFRPGIVPNSLNAPGDMKIWIADQTGPTSYLVHGPRYLPTAITYGGFLSIELSSVVIETPYRLPADPGIYGATIQFQVGHGHTYLWQDEPFPPEAPVGMGGGYSTPSAQRARARIPIWNTIKLPPTHSSISPQVSGNGWFKVDIECGDILPPTVPGGDL